MVNEGHSWSSCRLLSKTHTISLLELSFWYFGSKMVITFSLCVRVHDHLSTVPELMPLSLYFLTFSKAYVLKLLWTIKTKWSHHSFYFEAEAYYAVLDNLNSLCRPTRLTSNLQSSTCLCPVSIADTKGIHHQTWHNYSFQKNDLILFCVWVFACRYVYVPHTCAWWLQRPEKGKESPAPGSMEAVRHLCRCWETNLVLCKNRKYSSLLGHLSSSRDYFFF